MDPILDLLQRPESKTLEYKRDLSSLEPILKTIVAFANTAGGTLLIGCSSEGFVLGIQDVLKAEEKLANAIADSIHPFILPEIEVSTVEGKPILIVRVAHWKGPFYLKKLGLPQGVFVRLGSTSRPAGPELVSEMQRTLLRSSYDEEPVPNTSVEDLDLDQMRNAFRMIAKEVDQEKLLSLGILTKFAGSTVCSIGGLLLFGKPDVRQRLFPDAQVSCARFQGEDKSEFVDRYVVEGGLFEAIECVIRFIRRNTRLGARIEGMVRKDIPEYSPEAIREVLINALAHADYSLTGSSIQVAIFSDRLEIQNPGMMPFGFTLEDFKAGTSRVRNRVIARVFHELRFMETWGSGYQRVVHACRRDGYPEPNWQELGLAVRVTFACHECTRILPATQTLPSATEPHLSEKEHRVLQVLPVKQPLAISQIAQRISPPMPERSLRAVLTALRSRGVLSHQGRGRKATWERL